MKKIIYRQNFSETETRQIENISKNFGIQKEIAEIIFSRGIKSVDGAERYLNKGAKNFQDPFLYSGMTEAVERIKIARENNENVLIYGDYDADGISAVTTLYFGLKEFGIENLFTALPERENGYGLNEDIVTLFAEECFIDLVITVDCGISDKDTVEFIKNDLGIDVIVTDHHEIPLELPDAIIINPKLPGQTAFDGLCGAGVAFKLSTALVGSKANECLDFVALATVADSMPLIKENRDIVYEGLKLFNGRSVREIFKQLLENVSGKEITATTLAYQVAPKINAAGRLGDARSALDLFLSKDSEEIYDLSVKLTAYNIERQSQCEKLYKNAKFMLEEKGAFKSVIMLYNAEWKTGFVGIVAARLALEYSRPVILFAGEKETLKGSARSIDGVNILSAISSCRELLIGFGGHAQAAGVAIEIENFDKFYDSVNDYLVKNYSSEVFTPKILVESKITEKFDYKLAEEINILEPTGFGNRKPLFSTEVFEANASPIKNGSPHISFSAGSLEMIYFNGSANLDLLNLPIHKDIIFEPNISVFNKKSYLKGYVRECIPRLSENEKIMTEVFFKELEMLKYKTFKQEEEYLETPDLKKRISEMLKNNFGACFLINDLDNLGVYPELAATEINVFRTAETNLFNTILLAPTTDISCYKTVVYLDKPLVNINIGRNQKLLVAKDIIGYKKFLNLSVSRDNFTESFLKLKSLDGVKFTTATDLYYDNKIALEKEQFLFCMSVFFELGIFMTDGGILRQDKSVKTDLEKSEIYKIISKIR